LAQSCTGQLDQFAVESQRSLSVQAKAATRTERATDLPPRFGPEKHIVLRQGQRDHLSFFVHPNRDGLPAVEVRSCHLRACTVDNAKGSHRVIDKVTWLCRVGHDEAHITHAERGRNNGFGPLQFLDGRPMAQSSSTRSPTLVRTILATYGGRSLSTPGSDRNAPPVAAVHCRV